MVPSGWNTLALSEITKEKISYGIVQAGPNVKDGIPYIKSADVGGEIDVDSLQRTAKEIHHKYRRSSVHPNDIVFSLRGNIARTSIVPTSLQEANLTQGTARISVNDKNDTKFVYYKLASTPILNRINALSKGSTFKEISLEELRKVKLALPPLEEQRKIAKILSTWDKAINTTERLIDNSKQQKKALMQQLLTGKKRLLDDSGRPFKVKWEEVKLGEISYITTGSSNREDSSLDGEYTFFDRSEDIRTSSRYLFDSEAVIVPGEGQDFVPKHFEGKFDLHQRTYAIMNFNDCVGRFLFYYIGYYRHYFLSQAVGSTVKSLRLPMFQKMPINLPNKLEQLKIASALNNADREIGLLEQQLADLKQEKKALMQQLLTGKRRVKVDAEAVA